MPCSTLVGPYCAARPRTASNSPAAAAIAAPFTRRHLSRVGAHDVLVGLHLGRRAVGDLPAEVEGDDLVGDAHHHVHVVLDEQHRQVELRADPAQQLHQRLDFLVVQAAGGLVEQKQLRLGSPKPGRARPAFACRTADPSRRVATGSSSSSVEQPVHGAAQRLLAPTARQAKRVGDVAPAGPRMAAEQDVVANAHGPEQGQVLERAADAERGDPVGGVSAAAALEGDRPSLNA